MPVQRGLQALQTSSQVRRFEHGDRGVIDRPGTMTASHEDEQVGNVKKSPQLPVAFSLKSPIKPRWETPFNQRVNSFTVFRVIH